MFHTSEPSYLSYLLLFIATFVVVSADNANITIPLNKTITLADKELYGDFVTIKSNSVIRLSLTDINKYVRFIIFQVHSHLYNVTLYNNTLTQNSFISGTNIGLYGKVKPPDTYYVINNNTIDIKLYISIHGYRSSDPIPGGCNLEFPLYISPFMYVKYTKDMISVDASSAQHPKDPDCLGVNKLITMKFYRLYLYERNFGEDSYFEGLRNMMTLAKIQENGDEVPQTLRMKFLRRLLGAYPGTGSIYVAVAYHILNNSVYSIYVPTHTYACSPLEGCEILDDITSQFFCAALFFIGLFICYFGHRFFTTEMFLVGMFSGILITYTIIPMWTDLDRPALLFASGMSGIFMGAIWLLFWWFYGIPVLSVFLSTMYLGYVLAAIVYYRAPAGPTIFENDGTFWTIFVVLMLLTAVSLSPVTYLSNILCCAFLGAYATVFALDHYIGSNLKYIVINTMRRAVVESFNNAVLAPPYQWRDAIATLLWVLLATSGFLFQHYHNRGKPPFPPPPRSISTRMPEPTSYGTIGNRGRRNLSVETGGDPTIVDYNTNERTPLL
ncbi:transmembrane 7 superfamily member 3-like [Pectinophora gossypiella]|uniref:transmembrane 7 superfamily member 3-like n=1 Tax=Pectinophora gossypiella TaxID=13191 RepID=UPI00214F5D85|nr:transmembrane 7 superfamily member 3-like [Pectinophora gossypiella]